MALRDLEDFEIGVRSLLMRLYHSRFFGEDFYPAGLVDALDATALEVRGWIERHAQGWRITEEGVSEWAHMNYVCLTGHQPHYKGELYQELRMLLEEEACYMGNICKTEGCDQPRATSVTGKELTHCREHMQAIWREKAAIREAKKREADAQPARGRGRPKKEEQPEEVDFENTMARTASKRSTARSVTVEKATAQPEMSKATDVYDPPDTNHKLIDVYVAPETTNEWIHAPLPDGYPAAADTKCEDCLYKDVVDLLIDRVPGVAEIVSGLKQVNGKR